MAISSTSPSSSGFNFDGVVSGLKTGDIISKLMQLDQAPLLQLQRQQLKIQNRDKAYQDIASKATSLQSAVQSLLLQSAVTGKTESVAAVMSAWRFAREKIAAELYRCGYTFIQGE